MRIETDNSRFFWVGAGVVVLAVLAGAVWWVFSGDLEEPVDNDATGSAERAWDRDWAEAEANTPDKASPNRSEGERLERNREPTSTREETSDSTVPTEASLESTAKTERPARVGQSGNGSSERKEYDPAVLRIVTNFDKADVTVNGLPYPEYLDEDEQPGMVLPAGGPYTVNVTYDGKQKTYKLSLRPYEVRYLMVELSGFQGGSSSRRPKPNSPPSREEEEDEDEDGKGRVTVYSKPKGEIRVDGKAMEQQTPGTVDVEPGQHNIQVKFEKGGVSETKTVRVRKGSRIKLFFRKNGDDDDE